MAKFTFLEVHLDGSSFTANAPFGGTMSGEATEESAGTAGRQPAGDGAAGGGGGRLVAALVGLLFLVVVAFLVRKYLGDGDDLGDEGLAGE